MPSNVPKHALTDHPEHTNQKPVRPKEKTVKNKPTMNQTIHSQPTR
jgi:hypothetical protein